MPVSVRRRVGVTLSAVACATGLAAGPSRTAHASPAYGSGSADSGSPRRMWHIPRGLDGEAAGELRRVLEPGSTVYLLGGPAALNPGLENSVGQLGFHPVRLGGADRYATAVAVATAISGTRPKSVLRRPGSRRHALGLALVAESDPAGRR